MAALRHAPHIEETAMEHTLLMIIQVLIGLTALVLVGCVVMAAVVMLETEKRRMDRENQG